MDKLLDRAFVATLAAWVMFAAVMSAASYTSPGITAEEARITNVAGAVTTVVTVSFFGIAFLFLSRAKRRIAARVEEIRAERESTR